MFHKLSIHILQTGIPKYDSFDYSRTYLHIIFKSNQIY